MTFVADETSKETIILEMLTSLGSKIDGLSATISMLHTDIEILKQSRIKVDELEDEIKKNSESTTEKFAVLKERVQALESQSKNLMDAEKERRKAKNDRGVGIYHALAQVSAGAIFTLIALGSIYVVIVSSQQGAILTDPANKLITPNH